MDILAYLIAIILIILAAYFLGIIRGAPFLPTDRRDTQKMVELAQLKTGDILVDLGSGDGRILIAAANLGAEAHGYEINPLLVLWSRWKIKKSGLSGKAFVHWKNYWFEDLSRFHAVTIFGITSIMDKIGEKLSRELKPGSRVICHIFPIPNWSGQKNGSLYVYIKR